VKCFSSLPDADGNTYTLHFFVEEAQKINENKFMRSILYGLSNQMRNSRHKLIP
jgi:hypothetical protein